MFGKRMTIKIKRAMQYTGSNLAAIISNFDINPEGVSVNFGAYSGDVITRLTIQAGAQE